METGSRLILCSSDTFCFNIWLLAAPTASLWPHAVSKPAASAAFVFLYAAAAFALATAQCMSNLHSIWIEASIFFFFFVFATFAVGRENESDGN